MRRFSIILFLVLLLSARDVPFVLAEDREIPQPSVTVVPDYYYPFEEFLHLEGRAEPRAIVSVELERQAEKPVKFTVSADSAGEWVVWPTSRVYLSAGSWVVRARQQVGTSTGFSDWSNPQVIQSVITGFTIFGINVRYALIGVILFVFVLILAFVFFYFARKIRRLKRQVFEKRLRETTDQVRRGFSEIHKDLMQELLMLTTKAQTQPLSPEEIQRKDHVLRELEELEKNVSDGMANMNRDID